jgi:hypothetical protein
LIDPAWVAAGAACVAAGAGAVAATSGVRTLRQARRDSKARSRPMIAAELRPVPYVQGSQKLVITNYGPSIAKNVWVTFDPPLPDPEPSKAAQSMTPFLKKRYESKISVMTPGMALENIYYSGAAGPGGKYINFEPVPDQLTVRIAYEDADGNPYADAFHLDVELVGLTTIATSSTAPEAKLGEIAKALRDIQQHLKRQRHRSSD